MGATSEPAPGMTGQLAALLEHRRRGGDGFAPLVLALSRGAPALAAEVAKVIQAELDVIEAREIRMRGNPEVLGAVTADGPSFFRRQALARVGRREEDFAEAVQAQRCQARKLLRSYHSDRRAQPITGRTVIVIDDGRSSEVTVIAALRKVRDSFPGYLVFASPSTIQGEAVRKEADAVINGTVPSHADTGPSTEEQIRQLLAQAILQPQVQRV